jgi:hypothetical protein
MGALLVFILALSLGGCELLSKLEHLDEDASADAGEDVDEVNEGSSSGITDNHDNVDATGNLSNDAEATVGGDFPIADPLNTRLHPGSCFDSIAARSARAGYQLDAQLGSGTRSAPLSASSSGYTLETGPKALQSDPLPPL